MPTAKAERLLNLVIALLNAPRFRTAAWIRDKVAGYGDAPSDEAFFRMFERDKQELRDLGIPIQTVAGAVTATGSRQGNSHCPPMSFTPAEAAALAMAGRLWDTTLLADAGSAALRKIRDAAEPADAMGTHRDPRPIRWVRRRARCRCCRRGCGPGSRRSRRCTRRSGHGARSRFDYRKSPGLPVREPIPGAVGTGLLPRRLVRRRAGHRPGRAAHLPAVPGRRSGGGGRRPGRRRGCRRGSTCWNRSAESDEGPARSALLRIRPGAAAGLRRGSELLALAGAQDGFDEVRIPLDSFWDVARRIAGAGPRRRRSRPARPARRRASGCCPAPPVPRPGSRHDARARRSMPETATDRVRRMLAMVPYISRRPGVSDRRAGKRVRRDDRPDHRRPRPADGLRTARLLPGRPDRRGARRGRRHRLDQLRRRHRTAGAADHRRGGRADRRAAGARRPARAGRRRGGAVGAGQAGTGRPGLRCRPSRSRPADPAPALGVVRQALRPVPTALDSLLHRIPGRAHRTRASIRSGCWSPTDMPTWRAYCHVAESRPALPGRPDRRGQDPDEPAQAPLWVDVGRPGRDVPPGPVDPDR